MNFTGIAMRQHQQRDGRETYPAMCAAGTRVVLGSSSILLQQLLRMAAAGAAAGAAAAAAAAATETQQQQQQQQQQQLRVAILYCADVLGVFGQALFMALHLIHACANEADERVDACLLLYSNQNTSTLARTVQAFEASIRHLAEGVPHAAAGSMVVAGRSSSSSSSSRPDLPPSTAQVEQLAVGIYFNLVNHATKTSSTRHLSCSQQQLLQAALSLLLTASKLWQAGMQPPVPLEALRCLTGEAMFYVRLCRGGVEALGGSASAAAAAVVAAVGTIGGVQVCHLVSRYFSCLEQQLRQWVAAGDAVGAAKWLLCSAEHGFTSLPSEPAGSAAAAAAGDAPTYLRVLDSVVGAVGALVPVGSVGAKAVQCWLEFSTNRSLPHVAACLADAQNSSTQTPWRRLLNQPHMADFILRAWDIRRAALTGREANGGDSMALTPVPAADITGA
jgi:hypothetical protein